MRKNRTIKKLRKEIREKVFATLTNQTCEYCGSTEEVSHTANPYASEIEGDDSLHDICSSCYAEYLDDI